MAPGPFFLPLANMSKPFSLLVAAAFTEHLATEFVFLPLPRFSRPPSHTFSLRSGIFLSFFFERASGKLLPEISAGLLAYFSTIQFCASRRLSNSFLDRRVATDLASRFSLSSDFASPFGRTRLFSICILLTTCARERMNSGVNLKN